MLIVRSAKKNLGKMFSKQVRIVENAGKIFRFLKVLQ